jgi:polar amino acid transport system substrate-binding protein
MGPEGAQGINVRILRRLAAMTGCSFEWKQYPWKRTLRLVRKGEVDVATTANKTPERRIYAHFSQAYLPYEAILFVKAGTSTSYENLRAFLERGKRLAVVQEYTYGDHTDALLASDPFRKQVYATYNVDENVRALAHGRVDGTIGNRYTLAYAAHQVGVRDDIRATGTVVQREPVHFMFSKKSVPKRLVRTFNAAIADLKADGRLTALARGYVQALK